MVKAPAADNRGFTKTDMERLGFFQEMGYTTVNETYTASKPVQFNTSASKGRQMIPGGSKMPSALQAGYFGDKFNRILEGESYSDPVRQRRQDRLKASTRNIGKPFLQSNGDKTMNGLGTYYGTIGGNVTGFSPLARPSDKHKAEIRNIQTNPGKKGTGYGYCNVTIGPYLKHSVDEYDRIKTDHAKSIEAHRKDLKGGPFKLSSYPQSYFNDNPFRSDRPLPPMKQAGGQKGGEGLKPFKPSSPGKRPGGMAAGTFDPYPKHSVDAYKKKSSRPVNVVNVSGKTFMPNAGMKSTAQNSIVNHNVQKYINVQNYKTTPAVMTY